MIFRIRFKIQGGHVWCRVFAAKAENMTFAKCGDIVINKGDEFKALLSAFSGAQFIGDDEQTGIVEAVKP